MINLAYGDHSQDMRNLSVRQCASAGRFRTGETTDSCDVLPGVANRVAKIQHEVATATPGPLPNSACLGCGIEFQYLPVIGEVCLTSV